MNTQETEEIISFLSEFFSSNNDENGAVQRELISNGCFECNSELCVFNSYYLNLYKNRNNHTINTTYNGQNNHNFNNKNNNSFINNNSNYTTAININSSSFCEKNIEQYKNHNFNNINASNNKNYSDNIDEISGILIHLVSLTVLNNNLTSMFTF
jgi:hypothetical protein